MTGKQQAVMWMGLTLIILRLFTTNQWKDIWGTILKGAPKSGGSSSGGGLIPGLPNIPFNPLLPGPLGAIPGLGISNSNPGGVMKA